MLRRQLLLSLAGGAAAFAQSDATAERYFSQVPLIDQDGRALRFYSDLVKGKVVLLHSFFSTCTADCPAVFNKLRQAQDALGEHFGKDVFFVSITVEPARDTQAKLKEFADYYKAKAGWSLITGKKENVDWALYRIGHYVPNPEEHKTQFAIGNETTGEWRKMYSTASAADILRVIRELL
jgi:protein SCO1/2